MVVTFLQKYSKGNNAVIVNNIFVFLKEKNVIKGLVWRECFWYFLPFVLVQSRRSRWWLDTWSAPCYFVPLVFYLALIAVTETVSLFKLTKANSEVCLCVKGEKTSKK